MPHARYLTIVCVRAQYFDMLKDVGQHGAGKTLFLPHGPDSVAELQEKLHNGIMKSMLPPSGMFR